jgi:PAS domain S-box-containing protein
MNVPVFEGKRIVVVAGVGNKEEAYDESDVNQLSLLMQGMWAIIQHRRDDQALEESEKRYRLLADNVADVIWTMDINQRISYMSPSVESMFGYTAEEATDGMTMKDFLTLESYQTVLNVVAKELAEVRLPQDNSPEPRILELEIIRKDRGMTWIKAAVSFVRDKEGHVSKVLGVLRDITQRKRLEEQLLHSQKMEAIGRLVGGIAHDFHNLLVVIGGRAERALRSLDDDHPLREEIEQIKEAEGRASLLTRQLLAFGSKQVLRPRVLDLSTVVLNIEMMLRRLIGEDITLLVLTEPDLETVKADPTQIEQVVMNLAVNARDAMPDGGRLTIEASNLHLEERRASRYGDLPPGSWVVLTVSDTGVGMNSEIQARLFEPFFTTKEPDKGTGLGLATVYGIVKQSEGHISVYSEPGMGSTFKIYLPCADEPVEAEKKESQKKIESLKGTETILLVEDEEIVRKFTRIELADLGYKVLEASNGGGALRICREHEEPIHMVITDVVMPGMNGPELSKLLTEMRPGIKVLFVSGYSEEAIARHGAFEEGIAFLEKPFTRDALARKVRKVLSEP